MRVARVDLVIGVGNPLRGDDGVGWWLARQVQGTGAGPLVRLVPQLTPELALEVAAARRVLVVDAWCAEDCEAGAEAGAEAAPTLRSLQPGGAEVGVGGGHGLDPGGVLALAALFGGDPPPAWLLLVPAFAFPHGTEFSAAVRRQLPVAQALLCQWLEAESPHA
jgi:hydrogenase maturation protease